MQRGSIDLSLEPGLYDDCGRSLERPVDTQHRVLTPCKVEGVGFLASARLTAHPDIFTATREAVAARGRAIQTNPPQVPFSEFPPCQPSCGRAGL